MSPGGWNRTSIVLRPRQVPDAIRLRPENVIYTNATSCDGPRMLRLLFVLLAPIAPNSGAKMCALAPADFQAAGVQGAGPAKANVSDPANVYCVYAGKSSATGGIELDVFNPAGANANEIKNAFQTAVGEASGGGLKAIKIAGADEAQWSDNAKSGGPPFALIVVRKGALVFVLGIPTSKNAQGQLTKLAELVLKKFQ